jgi:hypothetical protein
MELAYSDEQNYQLELYAYRTSFPNFKYKPPSFMFVEIGISSKVLVTPSMVQPVIKPISPLRGGMGLEIIPLLVQTYIIHVPMTIIVNQFVEGSEKSNKE